MWVRSRLGRQSLNDWLHLHHCALRAGRRLRRVLPVAFAAREWHETHWYLNRN